mgnify:CR=1 FL=1
MFFLSKIKEFLELRFSFSWKADNKSRPQADVRHPVAKFSKEHFNLFPHLSVLENVAIAPMKVRGKSRAEAEKTAGELLERVGLGDKIEAFPAQLSGGLPRRRAGL